MNLASTPTKRTSSIPSKICRALSEDTSKLCINYEYDYIDDDEAFDRDYEAYAEFEWECRTGR